nr:MAG TPA: hypothetical protein [Caudoviricetes sp.]
MHSSVSLRLLDHRRLLISTAKRENPEFFCEYTQTFLSRILDAV